VQGGLRRKDLKKSNVLIKVFILLILRMVFQGLYRYQNIIMILFGHVLIWADLKVVMQHIVPRLNDLA